MKAHSSLRAGGDARLMELKNGHRGRSPARIRGRLFASLAATDRPSYRAPFRPLAGGVSICERDQTELDAALDGDSVAAVIVEPVQGEGGVRVVDRNSSVTSRKITSDRGIALHLDEIQVRPGPTRRLHGVRAVWRCSRIW